MKVRTSKEYSDFKNVKPVEGGTIISQGCGCMNVPSEMAVCHRLQLK